MPRRTPATPAALPWSRQPGQSSRRDGPGYTFGGWLGRLFAPWLAARWAARMIQADAVVIDTETTDFDGAICELAVVDLDGTVLFETLLDPGQPIAPAASGVHGLTDLDVAGEPHFVEVVDELLECIGGRPVLAYNAPFDRAALRREAERVGVDLRGLERPERWGCVMRARAASEQAEWRPLHGGHRACADAIAAARIVRQLAAPRRTRDMVDQATRPD